MTDSTIDALIQPWQGPLGGLPPLDAATPDTIEAAYRRSLALQREEVAAIAGDIGPPSFAGTAVALERSGRARRRVEAVRQLHATTCATPEMSAANARIAPLAAAQDDEIGQNARLFARIEAVLANDAGLDAGERRLGERLRDRMVRCGARLDDRGKTRLREIRARLAELQARFHANLLAEQGDLVVQVDDPARLSGLAGPFLASAAALADSRGVSGHVFTANRPTVMTLLGQADDRALRHEMWRLWRSRGANPGACDNRPIANEIIALRHELAGLFGYPSFAAFACADRMAGTPARARDLLLQTWQAVLPTVEAELAQLAALAAADGVDGPLQAWDRPYYAQRLKAERFGFDAEQLRPYLSLDAVIAAVLHAAGRLHGLAFAELPDAPRVHPDIRVFAVSQADRTIGALWLDLIAREGKGHGSWQYEMRAPERFEIDVPTLSAVMSSNARPADGGPVLMGWEYANVLFHEIGHALHMLLGRSRYPSLGSMAVAWDFIEVPALLNEQWLLDRDLLGRFARHHETGEPMPATMIDALEAALRHDRVFSLTLDYLAVSLVDLALYDETPGDAQATEEKVLDQIGLPRAIDPMMWVTASFHSFNDGYAAGVYSYLWADVMAADIGEAFHEAPGGLYDAGTAKRLRDTILSVGATVPAEQAFRDFRGRDPDGGALLRRFGLGA